MSEYFDRHQGLLRWFVSTNHRDIGTLYLCFALMAAIMGGLITLYLRTVLLQPGPSVADGQFYNQMVTMHALLMIFGAIIPAFIGLASWQLPLMIGAPDLALPRMNGWSFWLAPFALILLLLSLVVPGGGAASGWTLLPPLSIKASMGMDFAIMALCLFALSALMGAVNIGATILGMRTPGMRPMKMPIFVWALGIAAFLLLVALPVLIAALIMLLADRHAGTTFFKAAGGGDPRLFLHLYGFFVYSGVHAFVLVAFGIYSQIIPTFARKPLFGYRSVVYMLLALGGLSLFVWGQSLYSAGLSAGASLFFMGASTLMIVPLIVLVLSWIATLWRGAVSFELPMLWALAGMLTALIGGLAAFVMALPILGVPYGDSGFALAGLHYSLGGITLFALFGAISYWLPRWSGRVLDVRLGRLHFWLSMIAFNLGFMPQFLLGLGGMVRHVADYNPLYTDLNQLSSAGGYLFIAAQLLYPYLLWRSLRRGDAAPAQAWEGAEGLEWAPALPASDRSLGERSAID